MKKFVLAAVALMVLALSIAAHPARAQGGAPKAGAPAGGPCADDLNKFCKDVGAGGGRRVKCLHDHLSELSAPCKQQVEAAGQRAGHVAEACKADTEKFCKDVQVGAGRVRKCLKAHEADLSTDCKKLVSGH